MNEDVKVIGEVKDKVLDLLHKANQAKEFSMGDVDFLYKTTKTIKNSFEIEDMMDGGYSGAGDWEADMRGTFGRGGNSYANRGKHYVRGHYSRDDGVSYRGGRGRYSRDGGYSQTGGKEEMISNLEMMMEDASSDRERQAIRRCIEQIENG